jgi:hypothetical protein
MNDRLVQIFAVALAALTVAVMTNCKTPQRNDSPIKSNGM